MLQKFVSKVKGKIKKLITPTAQYKGFPYVYARYYYWKMTGKHLCYSCPKNINEKLFWLNRYWQHPLIVQCCDKIEVRKYVASCNLSHILNPIYATYDSELDIDFEKLPDSFVLKTNNNGASWFVIICHDKNVADLEQMRINMRNALNAKRPGILVADFQYQYIKPQIIA